MSVHVDISVFTEQEAVGRVSGEIELPILPQIGDIVDFDTQGADVVRHKAAFGMDLISVTHRTIWTRSDLAIALTLSDITAKTKDDALQIMAFFEDCHDLIGDRWDGEKNSQTNVEE